MVIGVYDSGLGGLSVWRELRRTITAPFVYFGDTAHVPYGEKSPEQLLTYFWNIYDFFQKKNCTSIVVACNTASALVLPRIQDKVALPVYGVIEGAVEATIAVSKGCVGILATQATIASGVYQRAFSQIRPEWQVFGQSAPRLAPLIEQGQIKGEVVKGALQEYLTPLLNQNVDTILLGCTHYPFLRPYIEEIVGPTIQLVDPARTLALKIQESLPVNLDGVGMEQQTEFYVNAYPERFQQVAELLLQEEISAVKLYCFSGERT